MSSGAIRRGVAISEEEQHKGDKERFGLFPLSSCALFKVINQGGWLCDKAGWAQMAREGLVCYREMAPLFNGRREQERGGRGKTDVRRKSKERRRYNKRPALLERKTESKSERREETAMRNE